MPFTEGEDANGLGTLIQRYFLEGRFQGPCQISGAMGCSRQLSVKRWATYPANLCPFLFGAEFSDREEDLGDAVGQAVEDATFTAIGKRTAEHFQHVLCGLE